MRDRYAVAESPVEWFSAASCYLHDAQCFQGACEVIASETKRNADAEGFRPRLKIAAMLLGTYVTMHLAVGGAIQMLRAPDAFEVAALDVATSCAMRGHSTSTQAAATPVDKRDAYASVEGPRERFLHCRHGLPMASDCPFNLSDSRR